VEEINGFYIPGKKGLFLIWSKYPNKKCKLAQFDPLKFEEEN